jgi:acetyltransferase
MDKHFLTPLFSPSSIIVFAGEADKPESLTPQARALHEALRAQRYTPAARWLIWPTLRPIWR